MNHQQIITIIISIVALCISLANFIFTLKTIERNKKIQERNDKVEVDSLLDKAFNMLFDEDGRNKKYALKDLHEAESLIRKAKELRKDYSRTTEYEGLILEGQGKIEEAKKKYKEASTMKPIRWQTHNLLGIYIDEDNYHFEKAIQINPKEAGIPYFNIANKLFKQDKIEESKAVFLKSLQFSPNSKHAPDKYKSENDGSYRAFEIHRYRVAYRFEKSIIRVLKVRHTILRKG